MLAAADQALIHLNETERQCVLRYISLLREQLAENLLEVWLFGSAARGDMWSDRSPMHSDIDLLILTRESVPDERQEQLLNETYELFLECGRQISPHFKTHAQFISPEDERARQFAERVQAEGRLIDKADRL